MEETGRRREVNGKAKKKTRRRESEKKRERAKGSFGITNFIFRFISLDTPFLLWLVVVVSIY